VAIKNPFENNLDFEIYPDILEMMRSEERQEKAREKNDSLSYYTFDLTGGKKMSLPIDKEKFIKQVFVWFENNRKDNEEKKLSDSSGCGGWFRGYVKTIDEESGLGNREKLDLMYHLGRAASEASGLEMKFFTERMFGPWEEELVEDLSFKENYGRPIKAKKFNYAFAKYLKNTTHPEGEGLHPRYCKECKEYYYLHHNEYKWDSEISTEQKKFDVDSWFCDLIFHWMAFRLNREITEQKVNDILFIFRHVSQETCDNCKVKEVTGLIKKGSKPGEFSPLPPN